MDAERRQSLQKLLESHLELQRYCDLQISIVYQTLSEHVHLPTAFSQERQHYYKHRDLAQRNKREYMSIIIDGMDQSKTNLPHFVRERKCRAGLWRLRYTLLYKHYMNFMI